MPQCSVPRMLRFLFSVLCPFTFTIAAAQPGPKLEANYLSLPDKNYSFSFQWLGDSVGNNWEAHSAMLLPVTVAGCPKTFYLQFDLGAPSTIFYRNKLREIHNRYPQTKPTEDSSSRLKNYQFKVGSMPVTAAEIMLTDYSSPTIDWKQKDAVVIIGSIGADFIENRVIMIDYSAGKFYNGIEKPQKISSTTIWSDFMFARRSVLLPAVIEGKKKLLFFDTGSSAFELLTDKATAARLEVPGTTASKYETRSWDRTWTATTVKTNDSVIIANQTLPLHSATYMEGVSSSQIEQMMKMGIGGMTGNKLFINSVLVLDAKTKKFALLPARK